jgi:hypothetical protein
VGNKKALWTAVLAFLTGAVLGSGAGFYAGFEFTAGWIGSNWLSEQAEDIHTELSLLAQLRGDSSEQAIEQLESNLDDDLISIEPDERINDRTLTAIRQAIAAAREYREQRPRTSDRSHVDAMVANVLAGETVPPPP